VSIGNGDGTCQPPSLLLASALSASSPVVADFNNDGNPDIAILQSQPAAINPGYSLAILLGNGNGTFRPAILTPLASLPATTLLTAERPVGSKGQLTYNAQNVGMKRSLYPSPDLGTVESRSDRITRKIDILTAPAGAIPRKQLETVTRTGSKCGDVVDAKV
jgi:hypothetical protein